MHAYSFTTIPSNIKDNIKTNHDRLINSAVLGLVFEKFNGYKEGSFYTPSFITSYMCKESLQKVVISKFNQAKGWDCNSLESLKFQLDKLIDSSNGYREVNAIFDSIRICDPSVGSGHFLVSALNELIYLKYRLNILCDENNQRLKDIILELHNDEILIRDSQNKIFNYSLPKHENIESHKIQKSLFQIKRKLIESCLFGVDINPNSCEITKLRLWIELLKYSYYKDIENKRLETLPNIDINIKCGNSLISRFDTKDSLKHIPNIKHQIDIYKKLVNDYKNADQNILISKQDLDSQIKRIKESFTLTLKDPKTRSQLKEAINKHIALYGNYLLDDESLLDGLEDIHHNLFGTPSLSAEEEESALDSYSYIQKLRKKLDLALKGEGYQDAFEWRFEFPEVLDSNGDFMGFDCVIGNPPYIKEADNKKLFERTKSLRTYQGKMDIWYHFVGRGFDIIRNKGILTFIATNNWTTNTGAKKLRNIILQESKIINLLDFGTYMVFDSASIQTMVMEFQKIDSVPLGYGIRYARIDSKKPTDKHRNAILNYQNFNDIIYLTPTIYPQSLLNQPLSLADSEQEKVLQKILAGGSMFLEEDEAQIGIGLIDKVKRRMDLEGYLVGTGIFQISTQELNSLNLTKNERKLIKPLYTSNELFRFYGNLHNQEWVIYTDSSFNKPDSMDKYPNLKKHLDKFQSVITSDNKPYGLHRAKQERFFNKTPSIVSLRKCVDRPVFTYVDFDCYVTSTFFILQTNRINMKLLTGILNSRLIAFWLRHKGKMQGTNYQIDKEPLMNIPIVKPDFKNKKLTDKVISLVDQILETKAKDSETDTIKLESQIDSLVYELYDLNEEEIGIIEGR